MQQRTVKREDLVLAKLADRINRNRVADEEADVDRTHVVAFLEVCGIDHTRVGYRNVRREVFEHAELLDFLHGEHVGRVQHRQEVGNELGAAPFVFVGGDDGIVPFPSL